MNYDEININLLDLNDLIFNKERSIYQSSILYDSSYLSLRSSRLRVIDLDGKKLTLEFLPNYSKFYELMMNIDSKIVELITEKGIEWFDGNIKRETIRDLYRTKIILPKDLTYFPSIEMEIMDGCKIEDKSGTIIESVKENNEVEILVKNCDILFFEDKCHPQYNIERIKIVNNFSDMRKYIFDDNYDNEIDEIDIANSVAQKMEQK